MSPEDLPRLQRLRGDPLLPGRAEKLWRPILEAVEEAASDGPVTLVVNDVARPPLAPVLEPVRETLAGRVRLLVAVGTHRNIDPGELRSLVGDGLADSEWRCAGGEGYVGLGTTSRGTPVEVDPWVVESSLVVLCGSVEPHYFAGFTGGRKSLLPGCCSRATTEANHFLGLDPAAGPGRLRGNPVHLDMVEALGMAMERAAVMAACCVVAEGRLEMMAAGAPEPSFRRAVAYCRSALPRVAPGSLSCAVLRPGRELEATLYQSMKAVYNWQSAMADGAAVLLESRCPDGLGPDHMEPLFAMATGDGRKVSSRSDYRLGLHAVERLRRAMGRLRLCYLGGLDDELVRGLGMDPVMDPGGWLDRNAGPVPRLVVDAGTICPRGERP